MLRRLREQTPVAKAYTRGDSPKDSPLVSDILLPYSGGMSEYSRIRNPHDRLFRSYYKYPAAAASLLRQALPPDISAHIDYDTLRNEEDTFITPSLREFLADLVFSCRLTDGESASVYVLIEHKSAPDNACAIQVLRYIDRKSVV